MLVAERAARIGAEAMIEHLNLVIAKMKQERFGQSSERGAKILDQLELQLADLEETVAQDDAAAQIAAARATTQVHAFARRKPARRPLPDHLPRERIVYPGPTSCPCCGGHLHICMTNNAAERAIRTVALGRKNWTFAGSDRGGERAAAIYSLIETAKLNDIDPQAWLADILARIADHPARLIDELLPWNWKLPPQAIAA